MIEKRQRPRVALAESVPLRSADTGEPVGRMINLSEDGFMVVADTAFTPGDAYRLKADVELPPQGTNTLDLSARCIWCQRSSYSQQFGAGFRIEQPTPDLSRLIRRLLDSPE